MGSDLTTTERDDRRRLMLISAGVAVCALVVLLATSPWLAMGWDEGNSIHRAQKIAAWARSWSQDRPADRPHPLTRRAIEEGWPYTTRVEGHPALYGIVLAVGHGLAGAWLSPLEGWRFGPVLLFSLATGAMFYRMSRDYGQAAGIATLFALLLQPRLFAHAHFANFDGVLTAFWMLAWAAFLPARRSWKGAVVFGMLLGMTMSSKATGWIAPLPFLLWAAVYRDRQGLVALAVGLPVALAAFYVLNPPLWHEPFRGLATFAQMNTHRQINVAILFLGRMYDLHHPLPWYNTLVWTAVVVPVGLLGLACFGVVAIWRRGLADRPGILLFLCWAILLVVRALPAAPPHDGIRLFLPSFAFLAALAGVGTAGLWALGGRAAGGTGSGAGEASPPGAADHPGHARRFWVAAVMLIFAGSATSLSWYAPQWLSYYNLLIGGLRGATRAGMEPTYYWDSLDREALEWLAESTAPGEKVWFGSGAPENLALMRAWGKLEPEYHPEAPGRYVWYVIQRRPSACMPPDQWLVRNAEPVYRKTIHGHGWGPWRLDVPLLEVYRFEDYRAAVEAAK